MPESFKIQPARHRYHVSPMDSRQAVSDWQKVEFWLPLIAIFLFCMTVSADPAYAESGGEEVYNPRVLSNVIRQAAFLAMGCVGIYLLTLGRPANKQSQVYWPVLLLTICLGGYLLASTVWSDEPQMTLKRSITAVLIIISGLGMGRSWNYWQYAWGIVLISSAFLFFSILTELRFRAFLSVDEYRFSGLFHPAKQAFSCGFMLIASLALYFHERKKWILLIAAVALFFLIMTKARTGTAAGVVAAAWVVSHHVSLWRWMIGGLIAMCLIAASLLFYEGFTGKNVETTSLTTMGRNEETADLKKMTGRLPIWTHSFKEFTGRPFLGHGYGAFWTMSRLAEFEKNNGWALYHSHSTYLETLLNLGIFGFILGMLILIIVIARSMALKRIDSPLAVLVTAVIIHAFIGGFFEIAFVSLEYESLVLMVGIGIVAFSGGASSTAKARDSGATLNSAASFGANRQES